MAGMIVIPKDQPILENLNSYYLNIERLLEHYQGEIGCGGIYFSSVVAKGVIFFDNDHLLNGVFQDREGEKEGREAIDHLMKVAENTNVGINIYHIDPDRVYFWANLSNAAPVYEDLSSEFTDLEGLIKKMQSERLTGFIEVSIGDGRVKGLLFFHNGESTGGSYSWGEWELDDSAESKEQLVRKSKESGGVFNVKKISQRMDKEKVEHDKVIGNTSSTVCQMLEQLLFIFERIVRENKKIKNDFDKLLKKKFLEKADEYDFLDPFAAEFQYDGEKITFTGNAEDERLAKGVIESVNELASELGILDQLIKELTPWTEKYSKEIKQFVIGF